MPYNAIDPFREAVERIVQRQAALGSVMPVDWSGVQVGYLQDGTREHDALAVSVTQLPDGQMGQFLGSHPDGRLVVTMQMDVWHEWRVAAEDLADAVAQVLDGGVAPGISSMQSGVRASIWDAGEVKWRVSQRFAITAHDEG